jgi:hypothetical protein
MNSTRDFIHASLPRPASAAVLAGGLLLASSALAETVSVQFSQSYPGGGTVTGLLVGEDLDGDGRLYAVAPGMAGFLGIEPASGEVTYASVRIEGLLGQPVANIFDASVADLEDDSNFFWGFAYNLDGGPIGDDPDEGLSFAPLAPSTSYTLGELFAPAITGSGIPDAIGPCGNPEGDICSAVTTLDPVDPFPNFELLYASTSAEPVVSTELLRYTFEQGGFDGGASVTGTVSGRDLDGDGRLYSVGGAWVDFIGLPPGDEIAYASVTIRGMAPEAIVNTVDLVTSDVTDMPNFFFGAAVNVAGDQLADEEGEGISIAPFSPSTSYVAGGIFAPFTVGIGTQSIGDCGNGEGLACATLLTLEPDSESPTGVVFPPKAEQYSAEPIAQNAAPFIVDGDFSGHWFNKTPQGEGLTVQVLDTGSVIVYWLTYDAAGDQRWLFGIGRREGARVIIDELQVTDGGTFATPVETTVDLSTVGELAIEFHDCDNATVDYVVDGEPGTLEIGRLTGLKSLECVR